MTLHGDATGTDAAGAELGVSGALALFRVLSDETRLRILLALAGGELDVTTLRTTLGLPQPTVSHHLAALRLLRLVASRRAGKRIYYRLGPPARVPSPNALQIECPHFALS